jgi:putative transcriptional regulator
VVRQRRWTGFLRERSHEQVIEWLGFYPEAGVIIRETSDMSKNEKIRKPLGDRLIKSMQQAVDFAEGKDVPGIRVHVAADCDVRKIRSRLKFSQREFARRYGFSIDSVQNWEQGRRIPDGPARTLLAVIAHEPKAVERALRTAG